MRNKRMDVLKAIGIILVVMGHNNSPFTKWLYTFHLPIFLFVSGFIIYDIDLKKPKEKSWKSFFKFILYKAKKILLPYLIFWISSVLIYGNLYYYIHFHHFSKIGVNEFKGLLLGGEWITRYSNNEPLWYLLFFFFASIAFEVVNRLIKKDIFKIIFIVLLMGFSLPFQRMFTGNSIFGVSVLPVGLVFMYFGYYFNKLIRNKDLNNITNNFWFGFISFMIGWYISIHCYGNIGYINKYTYFPAALFMIIGIYAMCRKIENVSLLSYIGQNTLYILGLHMIFSNFSIMFVDYFLKRLAFNQAYIRHLLIVGISIGLCLGVAESFKFIKKVWN